MKKISIVIVTHNSEKDIFDCIRSIFTNNDLEKEEIEIIVVDNNSDNPDRLSAQIHSSFENITVIKNINGGYGQGNNVGIRFSTSPIILIMNPDVRLTSPCFAKVVGAFKKDEKLVMYGMKQIADDNTPSRNSFFCTPFINGYLQCLLTAICNRYNFFIPSIFCFSGSCFFIRKSHFTSVGMFDESVFMYGEESDIHHRLKRKYGPRFKYDKNTAYKHLTQNRKFDASYEDKVLKSTIEVGQKYGYPAWKVIRNKIQSINILIQRERTKKILWYRHSDTFLNNLLHYKAHLIHMKEEMIQHPHITILR